MKSLILYFQRSTPQMEQIFNSYMQDAVNLYNEEFLAEAVNECGGGADLVFIAQLFNQKWLEMIRDN